MPLFTRICAYCQQPFTSYTNNPARKKYCSQTCRDAGYAALRRKQIPVVCANPACQKSFTVIPERLTRGQSTITCSLSCRAIVENARRYPGTFAEKFWAHVEVKGSTDCWPWRGKSFRMGYGMMHVPGKRGQVGTHVIAWFFAHHEWPQLPDVICHRCDFRPCCNEAHLWKGTQRDNIQDAAIKARMLRGEAHPASKLTDEDWIHIQALLATGEYTRRTVGHLFGVSAGAIQDRLETIKRHEKYRTMPQ